IASDSLRDLDRAVAGRAAGPVGDRHEVRLERLQRLDGGEQLGESLPRLRRKELDREAGAVAGEDLVDVHGRLMVEASAPCYAERSALACRGPTGRRARPPTDRVLAVESAGRARAAIV